MSGLLQVVAGNRKYTSKELEFLTGLPVMPAPGEQFYGRAYIYTGEDEGAYRKGHLYICLRAEAGESTVYAWEDIGPEGAAMRYEDLTEEQREALRGPAGADGADGGPGPRGEPGPPGAGFAILGLFPTVEDLKQAHPAGNAGDAYAVGDSAENTIYIWDADAGDWADIGGMTGNGGGAGGGSVDTVDGVEPDAGTKNIRLFRYVTARELADMRDNPALAEAGVKYAVADDMSIWTKDPDTGVMEQIAGRLPLADDLVTDVPGKALDAVQGKALRGMIGDLDAALSEKLGLDLLWSGNWGANGSSPLTVPGLDGYAFYAIRFYGAIRIYAKGSAFLTESWSYTETTVQFRHASFSCAGETLTMNRALNVNLNANGTLAVSPVSANDFTAVYGVRT